MLRGSFHRAGHFSWENILACGCSLRDRLPMWGRLSSLRPAFQPALAPFTHRPPRNPMPCFVGTDQRVRPFSCDLRALACSRKGAVPRGASRQACHAGGHAGRATQSRTVRESQRHPARTTARSTSNRRPKWGRLSNLRPAFQPALAPFTHRPPRNPMPPRVGADQRVRPLRGASRQACHAGGHAGRATQSRTVRESQRHPARTTARSSSNRRCKVEQAARLAMPAVTPAEQRNPERYGSPNAIQPARLRAPAQRAGCRMNDARQIPNRCGFGRSGPLYY